MEKFPQRAAYADPDYRTVRRLIRAGAYGPCVDCGTWQELEADHKVPLAQGGSWRRDNLVPRCRSCNVRKGGGVEKR